MPTRPVILANGTALAPIGTAAESSLPLDTAVALSLQSTSGYTSFAWTLIGRPAGSTAALTATSGYTSAFTPDEPGEYQVKGIATGADGTSSARVSVVIVKTPGRLVRKAPSTRSQDIAQDVDALKSRLNEHADVTDASTAVAATASALRAMEADNAVLLGRAARDDGGGGVFAYDPTDTTSADDGALVYVNTSGRRFKRLYDGAVNVQWFGVRGNYTADDTAAWQSAVDAFTQDGLFSGQKLYFPPLRSRITTPVLIGGAGNPVAGLIIEGSACGFATGAKSSLVWDGDPGGTILRGRNAHSIAISGINFDGRGIADYCVQARHVPGDLNTAELWRWRDCRFESGRVSNVLMGDTVPSSDDLSCWAFYSCFFGRGWANAQTNAHLTLHAWNAFGVALYGCQMYGSPVEGSASYFPQHGIRAVGGNVSVHGGSMNALGRSDFFLVGAVGCDPVGLAIHGVESQSYSFLETDASISSSNIPQRGVVVTGGYHTDSSGLGSTKSIHWDVPAGFAPLVLNGFRPQHDCYIGAGSKVWVSGDTMASAANFTGPGADYIAGPDYQNNGHRNTVQGNQRRGPGSYDTTHDLGAYQPYAAVVPQAFAMANGEIRAFAGSRMGKLMVSWDGNPLLFGAVGEFILHFPASPGVGVASVTHDPASSFSGTKDTAGRINVYWNAATSEWTVQNLLGGGARVSIAGTTTMVFG